MPIKKKPFLALFVIIAVLFVGWLFFSKKSTVNYKLNNKNYRLLVADSEDKWGKGLMFYRNLKSADGMIFIFPDKRLRAFWNKNTYLDLDVYWLENDKVVGLDFLPSIEKTKNVFSIRSPGSVDKVIEIVAKK